MTYEHFALTISLAPMFLYAYLFLALVVEFAAWYSLKTRLHFKMLDYYAAATFTYRDDGSVFPIWRREYSISRNILNDYEVLGALMFAFLPMIYAVGLLLITVSPVISVIFFVVFGAMTAVRFITTKIQNLKADLGQHKTDRNAHKE